MQKSIPSLGEMTNEMFEKQQQFHFKYGRQIPTSVLSFSAREYLISLTHARIEQMNLHQGTQIGIAEALWKSFVDPNGEDQMTRAFDKTRS